MRYLISFFMLLLASCATTPNYYGRAVNSWNGGNAKTLLQHWGPPNQTLVTTSGATEYVYMTSSHHPFPYPSTPDFVVVGGRNGQTIGASIPPNNAEYYTVHCTTSFVADKKGNIIAANYSGGDCFASEAVSESRSNPHK